MSINEGIFQEFILDSVSPDSAHDLGHIERVVQNAKRYAAIEHANLDIVIPAAWLHDCVKISKDSPDRAYASTRAAVKARKFLLSINYHKSLVEQIGHAIEAHSYSANIEATTIEARIVQDADRIDALGAIGISRCLLVGGSLNRTLYSTVDPFCSERTPDDENFCIDHFFRKLFRIADTLQTDAAKIDAVKRVKFMKIYLAELNVEISS
jgi:uncharacterized protein